METRSFTSGAYCYGFNGKEKDNEVSGSGNSLDFGARIYNSRLGRWLSVDPLFKKFADYSTFNYSVNNPICFKDEDGQDVIDGKMLISYNKKSNIYTWHASYFYFTRTSTAMSFIKNFSNGHDSKLLGIQNGDHKAGIWSHHTLEINYYPDRDAATARGWTSLYIRANDGNFKPIGQIKSSDLIGIESKDLQVKTVLWVEYSRRNTGSGAQVLAHEAFVHAESMIKEAEKIRSEQNVSPEEIINRMEKINSFNNSNDKNAPHHQFKINKNANYENWLKEAKVVMKDKKEILKSILNSDKDDKANQK